MKRHSALKIFFMLFYVTFVKFYPDYIRYLWCRLKGENYIGRYIYIMSKREINYFYYGISICGGYTFGHSRIAIFLNEGIADDEVETVTAIITHECLHQVLLMRIGKKAFIDLDKIHKLAVDLSDDYELAPYHIYGKFIDEP